MTILQGNSRSIAQKSGEICTGQADLQPISFKSDRLLDGVRLIAQRLLRLHPLRAADSLQLAAALLACEHRPQGWQFVCLDARLSLAAEREGFNVIGQFAVGAA